MLPFYITILGSSSATPTADRNPTAQLVCHSDKLFLVDCGEGTQISLRRLHIHFQRINHIFISHLHGDHFYGLIGLISSMHLLGRTRELHVYGPPQLKEIIEMQLFASQTVLVYPLIFHETQSERPEVIYEDFGIEVSSFPMNHRIATTGFIFREKPAQRRIRKDVISLLGLSTEQIRDVKNGADFVDNNGKVTPNAAITLEPAEPRVYVYFSDTAYSETYLPLISGADLVYHETTFMKNREANATEKFHSTTLQAATLARKAHVQKLLVGHYSARYDDLQPLLAEVREVFQHAELAIDGLSFEVRGEPSG